MNIRSLKWLIGGVYFIAFQAKGVPREDPTWLSQQWETVKSANVHRDRSSLENLGPMVRGLGKDRETLTPEMKELFDAALNAYISIPDYDQFLTEKIQEKTEREIAGDTSGGTRYFLYQIFEQIKTPKTVHSLGELLFDERNPWKKINYGDVNGPTSNSLYSLKAFNRLGLKDPPVKGKLMEREDLHTWQLWYQQVRAGTRTFSFIGDDKVYTLAGPVGEVPGSSTTGSHRSPKSGDGAAAATGASHSPWPLVAAAVAATAALFMVFRKTKKRVS